MQSIKGDYTQRDLDTLRITLTELEFQERLEGESPETTREIQKIKKQIKDMLGN